MKKTIGLLAAIPITLFTASLHARIIQVPADSSTIQGGIDGASTGDTVMIAPGIYYEHDIDFLGKRISVTGTHPRNPDIVAATVVDGSGSAPVFRFHSGEDSLSLLAGLSLVGSDVSDGGGGIVCESSSPLIRNCVIEHFASETSGGGIRCVSSAATIRDCIVRGNSILSTYGTGGGVYAGGPSDIRISGCEIAGNGAGPSGSGGGVAIGSGAAARILDCLVRDNGASVGGGIWAIGPLWIEDTEVRGNRAYIEDNTNGFGGGIYARDATIRGCRILENEALQKGGGIFAAGATTVETCEISGNSAVTGLGESGRCYGGGIFCEDSPAIANSIISGNIASGWYSGYGGGVFGAVSYEGEIVNSVICSNVASSGSGSGFAGGLYAEGSPAILNSIIRDNLPGQLSGSGAVVSYSDIQGGWEGEGNIDSDPLFVSLHGYLFLLHKQSPCIDSGSPAIEDGVHWPPGYSNGPRSDMGAYGGPGGAGWLPRQRALVNPGGVRRRSP